MKNLPLKVESDGLMGRAVTQLQYSRGQDLMTLKCLPAPCSHRNHSTILSRAWPPLLSDLGKRGVFHRTVNSNVRGFTVSLHLGYFLAVGSFMVLINLGKRIYCQKQESLPAFLVLGSNRVSERGVLFACTVNTRLLLSFQRSIWIFLLNKISLCFNLEVFREVGFKHCTGSHTAPMNIFQFSSAVRCQ